VTDFHIRDRCRLCGDTRLRELLRLNDTPLANEYPRSPSPDQERFPLYLVGCEGCGHVQLPVVVKAERLFPPDYPYQSGTSAVFHSHLKRLSNSIREQFGEAVVLDVGCNDGTLVKLLRGNPIWGSKAYGIDPCCPDGIGVREFFTEAWASGQAKKVGVVTALNVFAHVDDLDDFTRGVSTVLEHDGTFIFEVGYLADVVKHGLFDVIYHEHLSYHHLSPLVRFFQKHGMFLYDAERIDSQGGSIRCYVRNCSSHQAQSKRLQALIDDESRSALWAGVKRIGAGEANWGVRRARDLMKARTHQYAVYGAPAKLTTLLHATDQADSVMYVLDDNPLKQGRYVPGTSIPIVPTSELYERQPGTVVIASWNFAEEIKRRHAGADCRWVVPFEVAQ
jgi:SAM-dependent methyltransferase